MTMTPLKTWHKFKREYDLHENSYFQWVQLKKENISLNISLTETMKMQLILSIMTIM